VTRERPQQKSKEGPMTKLSSMKGLIDRFHDGPIILGKWTGNKKAVGSRDSAGGRKTSTIQNVENGGK